MKKISQKITKKEKAVLILLTLALLVVLPMISFAGKTAKIYVDDSASGTQDGSSSHPYKTIKKALKEADKNTKVYIRAGSYKENIEIPEGVEVEGADSDAVFIKADDKDLTTVKMQDDTKLMKVTVMRGKEGVKVKKGDKALIYKCVVKDAKGNGIYIEDGNTKKDEEVVIVKSEIKFNDRDGIFSEGRKIVIENSIIRNNGSDGVDLGSGSRAWIKSNTIKDNKGSGLKIELDGAQFFSKKNKYSGNKREGVEVELNSKGGLVKFNNDKFKYNGNYAIAKVQKGPAAGSDWSGLEIGNDNEYIGNGKGNISHIFKIF